MTTNVDGAKVCIRWWPICLSNRKNTTSREKFPVNQLNIHTYIISECIASSNVVFLHPNIEDPYHFSRPYSRRFLQQPSASRCRIVEASILDSPSLHPLPILSVTSVCDRKLSRVYIAVFQVNAVNLSSLGSTGRNGW